MIPALFLLSLALPQDGPTRAFLDLSAEDAFVRAEREGKKVLCWFHDPNLVESRRMARIFEDEGLAAWMRANTIAIDLLPGEEQKLASRLGASTLPASFLLDKDRNLIERIDGSTTLTHFQSTFELALIGSQSKGKPEGSEDPYAWLAYANHLFATGNDPAECLDAYFWVLDNGEAQLPGLRARLLEFLLKRLVFLKLSNEDAQPRLVHHRDQLLTRVATGQASDREAYELTRFNFWMRETHDTQRVFELLDESVEAERRLKLVLLLHDLEMIVAYRQYSAVRRMVPDPLAHIRGRFEALDAWEADPSQPEPFVAVGFEEGKNRIVSDASLYYEALLAEGQGQTAQDLADLVFEKVPTGRAFTVFMSKSNRLGFYALSRKTGALGLERTGSKGQKMIRTALVRIDGLERKALGGTEEVPAEEGEAEGGDGR